MLKEKALCGTCHAQQQADIAKSAHANMDKVKGDHPTCASCHSKEADPHTITRPAAWSRKDKVTLCSRCHAQKDRMNRYGVDPDAVSSYDESFHGKALLSFGMNKAAICGDCHKHHDVLAPTNPAAPTNRAHAAKTCAQAGCHPGARVNFAMSGANHLRLKVKQSMVLRTEEFFFRWLTIGTILFLLGGVALDLRRKVFSRGPAPASGRLVAFLISVSFLLLCAALLMAFFGVGQAKWSILAALVVAAVAFVLFFMNPHRRRHPAGERQYQRLSLAQRWQHILLAISFTLLVLTGLPLRFAHVEWLHPLYAFFGGMGGARVVHRVAAVIMIADWIWHTLYLIYRWQRAGFNFRSWTMFPTLKDVRDFIDTSKHYFGLTPNGPRYDRFQFREKFDYFAVYWGMPIMVFSGLVLWFPIYFGNLLPETGLSVAYIAHSDEAILAFLAIVMWHFYNTHFDPENFPMSPVFLTGTKSQSEMEREHPLEKERIDQSGDDPDRRV
jgi:cytochrome b subunit of formate dehydrogenase